MNLREAIGLYVVGYLQCQEVIGMEGEGVDQIRRQAGEVEERLDCVVKVAELALAIVEQQEAVEHRVPVDVVMGFGRLWEQYKAARDKAKEVTS